MDDFNKRKYKSLLEDIINYVPNQNITKVIDSKSEHIFSSIINLFDMIREELPEDKVEELLKFF